MLESAILADFWLVWDETFAKRIKTEQTDRHNALNLRYLISIFHQSHLVIIVQPATRHNQPPQWRRCRFHAVDFHAIFADTDPGVNVTCFM